MSYSFDDHYGRIKTPDRKVTVRGEDFVLPGGLPVSFYFAQISDEEVNPADLEFTLLNQLFGKDKVDEWLSSGMSLEEYRALLTWVGKMYAPKLPDGDDPEAADDPKGVGSS